VRTSITGVDDTRSFRALSRITQALVATVGTYSLTATGTPPVFFFKSAFRRAGRDDRVCAGVMVAASRRAVRGAANLDGRSIACSTRAGAPDGSRSTPPHHSTLLLHDAEARAECWRRRDPTRPCSTRRAPTVAMTRSRIAALHPRPGAAVVRPGFRGAARPSQTCATGHRRFPDQSSGFCSLWRCAAHSSLRSENRLPTTTITRHSIRLRRVCFLPAGPPCPQ
jgi:hypothetical protein